jgi:hypothetical protein
MSILMNIAEKAYVELFPEKASSRMMRVRYSRAFRPYNANVRYTAAAMVFSLSRDWKEVSEEIRIGLIQSLLIKVLKEKRDKDGKTIKTINMDLYENFLRNIGDFSTAKESDPLLEESFDRVNSKYFAGMMERPSLRWGSNSFSKLGSYEYGSNTITISLVLQDEALLLDYVMYHEMLHKKHKFHTTSGRSYHHTKLFREKERAFEDPLAEEKLKAFLKKKRFAALFQQRKKKKRSWFWF